jgi:hypothetical protein
MMNPSVSRRLRLFILSLSLFCSGAAAAQSTETKPQAPGVSVLEWKWLRTSSGSGLNTSVPTTRPVGDANEGVPDRSQPVVVWSSGAFVYSVRVRNEGAKVVRSFAWDYVFIDHDSKLELGRRSLNAFEKVGLNQTKWIHLRPLLLGPPKLVTVKGLEKNRQAPFDEHVEIKCLLFTDGSGWKAPDAETKTCDELVRLTLHPPRFFP